MVRLEGQSWSKNFKKANRPKKGEIKQSLVQNKTSVQNHKETYTEEEHLTWRRSGKDWGETDCSGRED